MKKLYLLAVCLMCGLYISAQTVYNTGYLQITLNKNQLTGVCNLDSSSNTIYIHSGAGYLSTTSLWDAVVGVWGVPDGRGEMVTVSDSIFTFTMNLTPTDSNYFSNPNTADSAILPIGSAIYNIGCVFRDQGPFPSNGSGGFELDNHLKGAGPDIDARGQCSDIWLIGVNTDSIGYNVQPITVVEEDYVAPIPAVTVQWVAPPANGINNISQQSFQNIKASPNPFADQVTISFSMLSDVTKVTAEVYDVLGRKVADFTPGVHSGHNAFVWGGVDSNGNNLPSGTYLLKVSNGSQEQTVKLIKI